MIFILYHTTIFICCWTICFASKLDYIYSGCYSDGHPRSLPRDDLIISSSMTPAFCVNHCWSRNHTLAGLQNSKECWCGSNSSTINSRKATESDCSMDCSGDSSVQCGGAWRISLYIIRGARHSLTFVRMFQENDRLYKDFVLMTLNLDDSTVCAVECFSTNSCSSFGYNFNSKACTLYSSYDETIWHATTAENSPGEKIFIVP